MSGAFCSVRSPRAGGWSGSTGTASPSREAANEHAVIVEKDAVDVFNGHHMHDARLLLSERPEDPEVEQVEELEHVRVSVVVDHAASLTPHRASGCMLDCEVSPGLLVVDRGIGRHRHASAGPAAFFGLRRAGRLPLAELDAVHSSEDKYHGLLRVARVFAALMASKERIFSEATSMSSWLLIRATNCSECGWVAEGFVGVCLRWLQLCRWCGFAESLCRFDAMAPGQ